MTEQKYVLGIDTSNYRTSVALVSQDNIICDFRRFLDVKQGERGLRQSDALFQHVKNLPDLFEQVNDEFHGGIHAVAYSSKPRPVEGSYMPCFLAGEMAARSIGSMLNVPVISFSHQEGHMQSIKSYSEMSYIDEFLACHFSGGTCEILKVNTKDVEPEKDLIYDGYQLIGGENFFYDIECIGGSKDISFGQVIDRAGVLMGYSFPAGQELDDIAMKTGGSTNMLTPITVQNVEFNLSGIDTQIKNKINSMSKGKPVSLMEDRLKHEIIREIFDKIAVCISKVLLQASNKTGIKDIIMSGGVSSSRYIRRQVSEEMEKEDIIVYFDESDLATDNGIGIALLGGKFIWD